MLGALARRNAGLLRVAGGVQFQSARAASTTTVWGHDVWRYEKSAFKEWVKASTVSGTKEQHQMYAFLATNFGDADVDKDGWIDDEEFDRLLESVAALPRRFGLAPSWKAEYGTAEKRKAARKAMFDAIDGADGFKPRGKIAMGQFITWAQKHVGGKAPTLDKTKGSDVALRHIEDHTKEEYLAFLDQAVNNKKSGASASFYNYLLTIFVEADEGCKGMINYDEFIKLIDIAAKTPRAFGLAPDSQDEAARKAMFAAMDSTSSGYVTFRKFLRFVRVHVREKLASHKK